VVLGIAVDATVVGVVVAFSPAGGTSWTVKASALLPFAACGKNFNVYFYIFILRRGVLTLCCKIR
jgi:hypothetical protein